METHFVHGERAEALARCRSAARLPAAYAGARSPPTRRPVDGGRTRWSQPCRRTRRTASSRSSSRWRRSAISAYCTCMGYDERPRSRVRSTRPCLVQRRPPGWPSRDPSARSRAPPGSTTMLAANRSPPMCEISQVSAGCEAVSAAATGPPALGAAGVVAAVRAHPEQRAVEPGPSPAPRRGRPRRGRVPVSSSGSSNVRGEQQSAGREAEEHAELPSPGGRGGGVGPAAP